MNKKNFGSVARADLDRTAAQRSLRHGQPAQLFVEVSGEEATAVTASLSDADTPGENSHCHQLCHHDLPRSQESDPNIVRAPDIRGRLKTFLSLLCHHDGR